MHGKTGPCPAEETSMIDERHPHKFLNPQRLEPFGDLMICDFIRFPALESCKIQSEKAWTTSLHMPMAVTHYSQTDLSQLSSLEHFSLLSGGNILE